MGVPPQGETFMPGTPTLVGAVGLQVSVRRGEAMWGCPLGRTFLSRPSLRVDTHSLFPPQMPVCPSPSAPCPAHTASSELSVYGQGTWVGVSVPRTQVSPRASCPVTGTG